MARKNTKVPVLHIHSFAQSPTAGGAPVTRFGGQPAWVDTPQWPIGQTRGIPMTFVGQIALDPEIFGGEPGRVAYLFVDEGTESEPTEFFSADGGDNAVIIQPGGQCSVPTVENATGPTIASEEYVPTGDRSEERALPATIDDSESIVETMGGNKIGGTPMFWDHIEYPDDDNQWRLLLQLTEEVPFPINCCLGMGYAFITTDGTRGAYFCQGG